MSVLLYRSEFGSAARIGNSIPPEVVWQKILTAPDDSTLELSYNGKKVGYVRWAPNVGEEAAAGKTWSDQPSPEGMVTRLAGYTVNLEGSFVIAELGNRIRFELKATFDTNNAWQHFILRSGMRPMFWEIRSHADERVLHMTIKDESSTWEQSHAFADFQNPQKLLADWGVPFAPLLPSLNSSTQSLSMGITWEARHDWLRIGHSRIRIYKLRGRLLENFEVAIVVSRVGEILRLEMPGQIVLLNDALLNL
ncbi:MAG: hypothetical protein SFY81_16930 [Verrucomicrobiota bacterium]|nr:hypothetical protein [Verrucomicrobiota bacterium]